jgi:hypothetical protein
MDAIIISNQFLSTLNVTDFREFKNNVANTHGVLRVLSFSIKTFDHLSVGFSVIDVSTTIQLDMFGPSQNSHFAGCYVWDWQVGIIFGQSAR